LAPNWHQTAPNFAAFRSGWHQNSRVFGLPCGGIIFSAGAGCSFFSPLCAASRCPAAPIGPVLKSAPRASCERQGMPVRTVLPLPVPFRRGVGGGVRSCVASSGRVGLPMLPVADGGDAPRPVSRIRWCGRPAGLMMARRQGVEVPAAIARWPASSACLRQCFRLRPAGRPRLILETPT